MRDARAYVKVAAMILVDLLYFAANYVIVVGALKILAAWLAGKAPSLASGIGWFVPGLA